MAESFTVSGDEAGERIDRLASDKTGITRSQIHRLIETSGLTVNGKSVKPKYRTKPGDMVSVEPPEAASDELIPEDIYVDIVYNDEHLVVADKPAGMVVHPAAAHTNRTLMNALRFRFGELSTVGAPLRPGVVHRLDKDTTGLIVVALSNEAYYGLIEQFGNKDVTRRYDALLWGSPKKDSGTIEAKIGRAVSDRKKMSTRTRHGKEARTSWTVVERLGKAATHVAAVLGTGRTHQIRVHFSSLGHPVLGDGTYGRKTSIRLHGNIIRFPRQMLHAGTLAFVHPVTGKKLSFTSPLPEDFSKALSELRKISEKTA